MEGQAITGEEEQFTLDMEELEKDGEQFTSVFTTLTMQTEEKKQKQLSATCRFSTFASISPDLLSAPFFHLNNLPISRVKSYGNDLTIDLSSSSSITVKCEKIFSKILVSFSIP